MKELLIALQNPIGILGILLTLGAVYAGVFFLGKALAPVVRFFKIKLPWLEAEAGRKEEAAAVAHKLLPAGECFDVSDDIAFVAYHLARKASRMDQNIRTAQYDMIEAEFENFMSFLSWSEFDTEKLWYHVQACLFSVVQNNHIAAVVDTETQVVDSLYLGGKVSFVKRRFLAVGYKWDMRTEQCIDVFFRALFMKFGFLVQKEIADLMVDVSAHKTSMSSPAIHRLVDRIKEGVTKWD